MRWQDKHKVIGGRYRALRKWNAMVHRTKAKRPQDKCYEGVEIRVEKEDFVKWFMENDYEGCSVDRIDPNGHYEWGNIQIIPFALNCAKAGMIGDFENTRCRVCREWKPVDSFVKKVSNKTKTRGIITICLSCAAQGKRLATKEE